MSAYTLTVADKQNLLDETTKALIRTNVDYVITQCLDRYIEWRGTLDFKVNIKTNTDFFKEVSWAKDLVNSDGCLPGTEMAWVGSRKSNLIEATTGKDLNGAASDAGFTIYLGKDGTLKLFGVPLWLDPHPQHETTPVIPEGHYDFLSVALHEIVHTLAFDGVSDRASPLGRLSTARDGVYYFNGENTKALLGYALPITPDNHVVSSLCAPYRESGLMRDYGNYDANRWSIGRIELALMKDLGYNITDNLEGLPYTDIDDKFPEVQGSTAADYLYGDFQRNTFTGGAGNDTIDGGAGDDVVVYSGPVVGYTITSTLAGYTITSAHDGEGTDTVIHVESLRFADTVIALEDRTPPEDNAAPQVQGLSDSDSYRDIGVASTLQLNFDEPVSRGGGAVSLLDPKGKAVACSVSLAGNALIIHPLKPLAYGTQYRIEIAPAAVTDVAGNASDSQTLQFITSDTLRTTASAATLGKTPASLAYEGSANFIGNGNVLANAMLSGAGDDTLNGGLGNDTLTGGLGTDRFLFTTKLGANNADLITDFNDDIICLSRKIFSAFKKTSFAETHFALDAAQDATDVIIYRDGGLYYDPDGNGPKASVPFAILSGQPQINWENFLVV